MKTGRKNRIKVNSNSDMHKDHIETDKQLLKSSMFNFRGIKREDLERFNKLNKQKV